MKAIKVYKSVILSEFKETNIPRSPTLIVNIFFNQEKYFSCLDKLYLLTLISVSAKVFFVMSSLVISHE